MKIQKRSKAELEILEAVDRQRRIQEILNSCFEKGSIDEEDQETILRWVCKLIPNHRLIYLFELIKMETFK